MNTPNDYDDLIDCLTADELVDITTDAIDMQATDEQGWLLKSVPRKYRLVHSVYFVTGFMRCNGAGGFLWIECDRDLYIDSMKTLGFPEIADMFKGLLAFTGRENLANIDAIVRKVGRRNLEKECKTIEELLYAKTGEIDCKLAAFIRYNRNAFKRLLPSMQQSIGYVRKFHPGIVEKVYNEIDWDQLQNEVLDENEGRTKA